MKTVVITGSTKGIGRGLAEEFLKWECRVVVSGRNEDRLINVQKELGEKFGTDRVAAFACDVTVFNQVQELWDRSVAAFGRIDIWINNAGMVNPSVDFHCLEYNRISDVVETNITGTMYGSKVALTGMETQGFGALYNFEGFGSNGRIMPGLSVYGATKRAVRYFSRSIILEQKRTPVIVGTLMPGMVITDLLMGDLDVMEDKMKQQYMKILNILADRVETVTPFLAGGVLRNKKHGAHINWLSGGKAFGRFMAAPFRKRNVLGGNIS